jgi:hypothetical protein
LISIFHGSGNTQPHYSRYRAELLNQIDRHACSLGGFDRWEVGALVHHEPLAINYINVGGKLINDAFETIARAFSPARVAVPVNEKSSDRHGQNPFLVVISYCRPAAVKPIPMP